MSEPKHTPGPWVVDYSPKTGRPLGITAPGDEGIPGAVGCVVRRNGIGLPGSETAQANARLIAAAPDLLRILGELCRYAEGANSKVDDLIDEARAAIAKAEGR